MTRRRLSPIPMRQDDLANLLLDMSERVRSGDSFEGSLFYEIPIHEAGQGEFPDDTFALVQASYRLGNAQGQGSVRLVGTWEES